jgi:predicted CXXCH cytochrome family protein
VSNIGKIIQFPEICTNCHKPIDPVEEQAHDEDDNRVCLKCFFAPLNEAREAGTVIAEV